MGCGVSSCSFLPVDRRLSSKILENEVFVEPISWDQLSKDLNIDREEVQGFVKNFAKAMRYGKRSSYYTELCASEKNKPHCAVFTEFYQVQEKRDSLKRKQRIRKRKIRRRFRLTSRSVTWAQKALSPERVFLGLRIRSSREFEKLARRSLKLNSCPRNVSLGLAMRAEKYFSKKDIKKTALKLFSHAKPCMNRKGFFWEKAHLKYGMIAFESGEMEKARSWILQSMEGRVTRERYRSLYWSGWFQQKKKVKKEDNYFWQQLLKEYPLSYYTISVQKEWGMDPMDKIPVGGKIPLWRKSKNRSDLNLRFNWLEALAFAGRRKEVSRWTDWISSDVKNLEENVVFYLSKLYLSNGYYRSNILFLARYYRRYPQKISQNVLLSLYPRPYFENIYSAARGKIDPNLVMSLIRQESAFDHRAVSSSNARGLMQILPPTARYLQRNSHRRLFNVKINTQVGIKYLTRLGNSFDGDVELVLAAYNAGPRRVRQWLRNYPKRENILRWNDTIPFMETRDYVVSVLRNNYWYERIYGPLPGQKDDVLVSALVQELTDTE